MSVRGIGDAFAFQRLLWLLVGTVIVPTVLLSLYGVMAIRNQQAALEEQLRRAQAERLQFAARALFDEIERVDQEVRHTPDACVPPQCAPQIPGVRAIWTWRDEPPASLPARRPVELAPDTRWFTPTDGGTSIGVFAGPEGRGMAWQIDPPGLIGQVQIRVDDRFADGETFALREVSMGPATPVEDLLRRWELDRFEATAPLQRPLASWELVLTYPGSDPMRAVLGPSRWLYPLGLVLLVAIVIVGTVVTLNSAAREIRLSRLQTDFVSSVSHELRTPLTSIRMFVETLQSGRLRDPERVDECLDLLAQETDRLSRMIERVLSWARMEAGRRVYDVETVEVAELVDDAVAAFRSQTMMEGTEPVELALPTDLPALRVDRDAIVEALVNLLQNAVKHTPSPRRIQLGATRRGSEVGLWVQDDGRGIRPADRKRVFEKFYQADTRLSSPTGANRGSGLGLSIVRAIVRGHGGRVELWSEEHQGSRFTLWLPTAPTVEG